MKSGILPKLTHNFSKNSHIFIYVCFFLAIVLYLIRIILGKIFDKNKIFKTFLHKRYLNLII